MDTSPPTVTERQHVERLAGSVMAGADAPATLGPLVSFRLGYVIARMMGETAAMAWESAQGRLVNVSSPSFRRFLALDDLFHAAIGLPREPES